MLTMFRLFATVLEFVASVPVRIARFFLYAVMFNPRLGPLRYVFTLALGYIVFALLLVYVAAPIRGYVGSLYLTDKLTYDAERWMATALYDRDGRFVGTYDANLDSKIADLNNVASGGMAGSIICALFLKRFVSQAKSWLHFDIYAWTPQAKPGRPEGGECQAARACYALLANRYHR